jgi:two-component system, sensor histidine kinase and response regulator
MSGNNESNTPLGDVPSAEGVSEPSTTSATTEGPNTRLGTARKVLIVDDTPDIRMIISESLKIYGFDTLTAPDGLNGIRIAKEHLPDLIICDINMPHLDGYGTLTALRESETTAAIPFIFLTGATDRNDMRRGMDLGADDYLTKPFTHAELMAAVNARLEKKDEAQRRSEKKLDELRGNITLALPHELRTPLNGIIGLASIMIEDYATMPPEEVLESARYINDSAMRLHRLIENFLVYSQISLMASESKRIETAGQPPVAVEALLPELIRSVAARFKRADDLEMNLEPARLSVPEENLKKIAEELTDNAFKFSNAGQRVIVTGQAANHTYQLTVKDHGRGIAPENISKIGPHMQFDRKIYEQQGSGLGLIISKRLTELLGGKFSIESKPGVETTVKVSFAIPGL